MSNIQVKYVWHGFLLLKFAVIDDLGCITRILIKKFSVLILKDSKGLFGRHVVRVKLDIAH